MDKRLSETYKIQTVEGCAFDYNGAQSFYMRATPVGSTEVEAFVLPHNPMWNVIVRCRRIMRGIWHPEGSYIWKEVYLSHFEGKDYLPPTQKVWIHNMLIRNPYDYASQVKEQGYMENYISGWEYKRAQLHNQYCSSGWIGTFPSFRSYVEALSEDDDTFWCWLFDNPTLTGYTAWSLPALYQNAFHEFLDSL